MSKTACWLSTVSIVALALQPEDAVVVKSWNELSLKTEQLPDGSIVSYVLAPDFAMPSDHEIFQAITIDETTNVTIVGNDAVLDANFRNSFFGVEGTLILRGAQLLNALVGGGLKDTAAITITATGKADFAGCSFTNCSSHASRGAIYVDGTALDGDTFVPVTFTNCTFAKNKASIDVKTGKERPGGAIFVDGNAKVSIRGCDFLAPTSAGQGQNDIANEGAFSDSVTFECPPGSSGKSVEMPKGATWSTAMLQPSKQVVHCG